MKAPLKLGLIGHPISRSASPAMHNAALAHLGISGHYSLIETPPGAFAQTLQRITAEGFTGVNITLPHKREALSLSNDAEESARRAGAANVLYRHDGKWVAANTDGEGLLRSLSPLNRSPAKQSGLSSPLRPRSSTGLACARSLYLSGGRVAIPPARQHRRRTARRSWRLRRRSHPSLKGLRILWLGAGGATRTAASTLIDQGAQLIISARDAIKGAEAAAQLGARYIPLERAPLRDEMTRCDLLIQATPATMQPESARALLEKLPLEALSRRAVVCDLVYRPRETILLRECARLGHQTIDGSGMLLHQAALAFRKFTTEEAPLAVMARALEEELTRLV